MKNPISINNEGAPLLGGKAPEKGNSFLASYFTFVAAFTGAGILALPYAISQAGLLAGAIGLLVLGFISNITLKLLGYCKLHVQAVRESLDLTNPDDAPITYSDVGRQCYGTVGTALVNASVLLSQFGFCVCYLIFIADNIHSVIPKLSGHIIVFLTIPIMTLLVWLRNLKYLSSSSFVSNIAVLVAVAVVIQYGTEHLGLKPISYYTPYIKVRTFPIFYGLVAFAFTVHSLALEVHGSMKDPSKYDRVVDFAVGFVTLVYVAFGSLSFMFFREHTRSEITLSLGDSIEATIVKIAICLVLVAAYPLQLFPVVRMIEEKFFPVPYEPGWADTWKRNGLRLFLVVITACMARAIPLFGLFASLVGAFSNSFISFIFPPLFYMKLYKGNMLWWQWAGCIFILVVGISGMIAGTAVAVMEIVKAL